MSNKSDYYLRSKYFLLEQPMKEAEKLFTGYFYDGADKFVAKDEKDRLDLFIQLKGKEFVTTARDQLTQLIDSHMSDDEIAEFIDKKLGSCDAAEPGESRDWLIEIRDYLHSKIDPLEQPMEEVQKLFKNYFSDSTEKNSEKDEHNRLDKFIKVYEKDFLKAVISQLNHMIESQLNDDELTEFIREKLHTVYVTENGESRAWLIRIRDYLQSKSKE